MYEEEKRKLEKEREIEEEEKEKEDEENDIEKEEEQEERKRKAVEKELKEFIEQKNDKVGLSPLLTINLYMKVPMAPFVESTIVWFGFMVFNTTFNNISVIPWRSVFFY